LFGKKAGGADAAAFQVVICRVFFKLVTAFFMDPANPRPEVEPYVRTYLRS
jgi:hypothetical protein